MIDVTIISDVTYIACHTRQNKRNHQVYVRTYVAH